MIDDQEIDIDALAKKLVQVTPKKSEDIDIDAIARQLVEGTDPGFKEYATGLPKALAGGAMDMTGAAVLQTGKLAEMATGDAVGQSLVGAGQAIQQAAPHPDPRIEGDLITRTVSGIGSSGPLVAGTMITGGLGGGPLAMALTAGGMSSLAEGGGGYQEAIARGADEHTARIASLLTMPLGALDAIGPETGQAFRLSNAIKPARAVIERAGLSGMIDSALSIPGKIAERSALGGIATSAVVEGVQETIQGKGEDIAQRLAGTIKNEEEAKSLWDVAQSDGIPAALGSALMEGVTQWITGGHARVRTKKAEGAVGETTNNQVASGAPVAGDTPSAHSTGGEVIEVPEPHVRAAVDKMLRGPSGQQTTERIGHTILTAPSELSDRAAATGATVVMVKADKPIQAEGAYDPAGRVIVLNADAGPIEIQRAFFRHELTHHAQETDPAVYRDLEAAVEAVAPGLIDRQAQNREGRQRVAVGGKGTAQGPVLSPDMARGEGTAEILQQMPTFEDLVRLNPDVAFKVATYQPGIVRRFADVLIDLAHAVGIVKQGSISSLIREIEKTLATPVEKLMGVKRGTQLALKVAELEKALRLSVPIGKPVGNIAPTTIKPRLDLPVVEPVEGHPAPLVRTPDDRAAEAKASAATLDKPAQAAKALADAEAQLVRLPEGKRRKKVERTVNELRAQADIARRDAARAAPKSVGDVVQLPSGELGRVTSVRGDTLKVLTTGPRRLGDPDTTLGLAEPRSRTVLASAVEVVSRPTKEAPGPAKPTKAQAKEAKPKKSEISANPEARASHRIKESTLAEPTPATEPKAKKLPVRRKESPKVALPFETATGGHAPGERIVADVPKVYADPRLKEPDTQAALRSMARWEAGWEQEGGKLTFTEDAGGKREVAGRTSWIAKADWWANRPENARLNENETRAAVKKAIDGEKLNAAETRLIQHMLDAAENREAEAESLPFLDAIMGGMPPLSDEAMDRLEREAIQGEGESEGFQTDTPFALPIKKRLPAMTKGTIRDVLEAYGSENDDQTARTAREKYVRDFQAGVRMVRSQDLMPAPRSDAYGRADQEIAQHPAALRDRLLAKVRNREQFEPWEHVALSKLADKAFIDATRTRSLDGIKEATRLRWVYEDMRRHTAQALGVVRDVTKEFDSAAQAFSSIISTGTRKTRRALAKIRAQLDDSSLSQDARFALQLEMDKLAEKEAMQTQKALEAMRRAGLDPELVTLDYFKDPGTFSLAARIASTTKASAADKFIEWRIAMMLGGPQTHIANITGNAANLAYTQVLRRVAESIVNTASRNPDAASWAEFPAFMRAWIPGLAQAGHNFMMAMRTEMPSLETGLAARGVAIPGLSIQADALEAGHQAIGGKLGRVVRFPSTTLLLAADEFFKTLVYHTHATTLAYRMARGNEALMGAILADADSPIHLEAWHESKRATFQDHESSKILQGLLGMRRGIDETLKFPVGSMLFPFVKTPYRIFQRGLAIPFSPVVAASNWINGEWKKTPGKMEQDIGSSLLGLGVTLAVAYAMKGDDDEEKITGSRAMNPGEAELQDRTAPAQSFKVGNQWISYSRVEPFSVAFSTLVDTIKGGDIASAASSIVSQASDKTFLRTVGDVQKLVSDVSSGADTSGSTERFATSLLWTPMFPNALRQPLRAADNTLPVNRVRPLDNEGVPMRALKALPYEAIPVKSLAAPEDYDLWGQPMSRPGANPFERVASPMQRKDRSDVFSADLVLRRWNELVEDGKRPGESKYLPRRPDYTYTRNGEKHYWSDADLSRLRREAGTLTRDTLASFRFNTEEPTAKDIDVIRKAIARSRKIVENRILNEKKETVTP